MSLDVYLYGPPTEISCICDCGHEHTKQRRDCFYDGNVTHNLSKMAAEAGIYEHLWRPDEISVTRARDLVAPLRAGLDLLRADPERFKQFNPENQWGSYDGLVQFVEAYLAACENAPHATISVSR